MGDPPIYSYRGPEDRELMARHWCDKQYNNDWSPITAGRVKSDLEELDWIGLAYLWREASGTRSTTQVMPDTYDPWQSNS